MPEFLPKYADMRESLFQRAFDRAGGDIAEAAALIGVHYTTIYRWALKKGACASQKTGA